MQFWSLGHFTLEIPSPTVRKDRRHIWPKMYKTKLESPRTIPTKLFFKKFFQIFFSAKISQFRYLIAYRYAQTRSFAIKLHVREYLNASSRAKVREYPFKSRISHQLARWRQCFYVFFNTLGHLNWIPQCWTVIAHCPKKQFLWPLKGSVIIQKLKVRRDSFSIFPNTFAIYDVRVRIGSPSAK